MKKNKILKNKFGSQCALCSVNISVLHLIPNYKVSGAVISKLIKANIHDYYYHY